jgi:release factor glutamine methyltransferase
MTRGRFRPPMTDLPPLEERLRMAGCVFAEDEAALLVAEASSPAELERMVERRAAGEPLEHVIGWADFCGLRIHVTPGVFVPRPRTELLAETAARLAADAQPPRIVVDLCCGSGAIAAAIAALTDGVELHAADADPRAAECARRNVAGAVYHGNLYDPLPRRLRGRVAVIAANAPYVPTAEIATLPHQARFHEPLGALDGGTDGLAVLRRVIAGAPDWLSPGGALVVESSAAQAPGAAAAMRAGGLRPRVVHSEELDATVVVGVFPP